jgi:uncharacterized protein DUF5753
MSESNAGRHRPNRSRGENGVTSVPPADGTPFTPVLAMRDSERGVIVNPFLSEHKHGWWDAVGKDILVDDALVYVELENEATKVRTFKIDLVDGLMQTPEYAAAVIRANQPRASDALVRQRVDARARRQARLHGKDPIHVEAIITEGALRIQVGGRDVMRRQLERLLELAELPNIDLRVMPAAQAYPAMGTPFYILSFESGYPDIGYIELLDKGVYLEEPDDVELYLVKFANLRSVALDPERSCEFIAGLASSQD